MHSSGIILFMALVVSLCGISTSRPQPQPRRAQAHTPESLSASHGLG